MSNERPSELPPEPPSIVEDPAKTLPVRAADAKKAKEAQEIDEALDASERMLRAAQHRKLPDDLSSYMNSLTDTEHPPKPSIAPTDPRYKTDARRIDPRKTNR